MNITYKNTITANETNAIRKSMGWRQHHPEQAKANLDGNTLTIAAYDEDSAIAMVGLRWNGGSSAIMSILLNPKYQAQDIEKEFTTRIFNFLRSKLKPGFGIQVDVYVESDQKALYESLGFQPITLENRGIPMQICLTEQIELTDKMFNQMDYKE